MVAMTMTNCLEVVEVITCTVEMVIDWLYRVWRG